MRKDQTVAEVGLESYVSVEEHIAAVRKAAEGLENPTFQVDTEYDYGDYRGRAYISGLRSKTSEERAVERQKERDREAWERKQLAHLQEKYGDA